MILYPGISRLQIPKFNMQGWRWLAAVTRMIDRDASHHLTSHPVDLVGRSLRVQCLQLLHMSLRTVLAVATARLMQSKVILIPCLMIPAP
jgi:hypothetical protein